MTLVLLIASTCALFAVMVGVSLFAAVRALDGCGPWEAVGLVLLLGAAGAAFGTTLAVTFLSA